MDVDYITLQYVYVFYITFRSSDKKIYPEIDNEF